MLKPERLDRNVIYQNPWVNLYVDKVRFPGGRIIEQHHMLDFEKQAVSVIVENERSDILFVQSYRYTTNSIEWEIPAGGIDAGESALDAARREAQEETGYDIDDLEMIYTYYPMNGISNKTFHIAKASVCSEIGDFDHNEVKSVTWFTRREVRSMIKNKVIKDGFSLTALLLHLATSEDKTNVS